MRMDKSSRHSKITGDFGENLVLYWLSKHGFESAMVDHTGIDIIARHPMTGELMGISVKTRSRSEGTENTTLNIGNDNLDKVRAACQAFGCEPYFAFVVDAAEKIQIFITSMDHLCAVSPPGQRVISWKMRPKAVEEYRSDPQIMSFEFAIASSNWWGVWSSEEIDEDSWLQAANTNPALASLNDPVEDVYSVRDGQPFEAD